MKFSIAVNMERCDPSQDMREVARNALELVQLAEQGGFEIAWAAEHHTIEITIGPNPFTILTHWAAHTSRIRLGTAVVVAPYWHPVRVAGEAALFDIFSEGRLEFGIGPRRLPVRIRPHGRRSRTAGRRTPYARDAAGGARAVARRHRA